MSFDNHQLKNNFIINQDCQRGENSSVTFNQSFRCTLSRVDVAIEPIFTVQVTILPSFDFPSIFNPPFITKRKRKCQIMGHTVGLKSKRVANYKDHKLSKWGLRSPT